MNQVFLNLITSVIVIHCVTGRAPMRFQYYELMDEYFKSSGSAQVQLETVDAMWVSKAMT